MQQLVTIDLAALFWFQSIRRPWIDPGMVGISHLGDMLILLLIMVGASLCFILGKSVRTGLLLLGTFGLAILLTEGVKELVRRDRPDIAYAVVTASSRGSFPSGHAVLGLTAYGSLAVALGRRWRSRGAVALLALGTLVLVLAIGFSRMYLGLHFVTDVVGGWIAGGALVLLFMWADQPVSVAWEGDSVEQTTAAARAPRGGSEEGIMPPQSSFTSGTSG